MPGSASLDSSHDGPRALELLSFQYASAVDDKTPERFVDCFTPDGWFEVYPAGLEPGTDEPAARFAGAEELATVPELAARFDETMHIMSNMEFDRRGDEATGRVTCEAHHVRRDEWEGLVDVVLFVRYHDRYLLTEKGWRIAGRQADQRWAETRQVR